MEGQNCCLKDAHVAVVMVPLPTQSHLNQLLHLSHLITSYEITVHYLGSHNRQVKLRSQGWDSESLSKIHFHNLQLPAFSSPPPNPHGATKFPSHLQPLLDASLHLGQSVCQLIQELTTKYRRIIVIHDILMSSVVHNAKSIPNVEVYAYIPISAAFLFIGFWEVLTEKPFQLDFDLPNYIPSMEGCFTPEMEKFVDYQYKFLDFQSGRLYNTCRLLEGKYVELLGRLAMNDDMKHFAIGPTHPIEMSTKSEKCKHGSLEWLDKQQIKSVIYVSFGTTTTITDEQIRELALGLEKSGQQFIWVLRDADKGESFAEDEANRSQLPDGYEERVKERGLVIRDWAPQLEILAHPSIGGFMSHCGWNSCLESISMGVPIAAWPMHSDQPRNAMLVTHMLRIGIMVRDWENQAELVTSATIENTVTRLMASNEGAEIRKRAAELGVKVRGAVARDGASRLEMESFIAHITR